ncbi:MAG: type II toxin-antitoxin system PrlF family antitoxin [Actinomycetota bacterium]
MARVTSKGQITIPKAIRDALGLKDRDSVLFRVRDGKAWIERIPNFLELAGTVPVPPEMRGLSIDEVIKKEKEALDRARAEAWEESERRSR